MEQQWKSVRRNVEKCVAKCGAAVFLMHPGLSPLLCGKIRLSKGQNTATDQARGCKVVRNRVSKKSTANFCFCFSGIFYFVVDFCWEHFKNSTEPYPTPRIPNSHYYVTKSVKWRYLGNQAWYHRSAGVKTTGKNSE